MLSLIASFCSIKAPIFAGVFYPYFIHISPCFSGGFPIRLSVRLYSLDYHGRPAKPKARIGGRLFPSCRLELVRLGIYQRVAISLIIRASAVFGPSRGGGGRNFVFLRGQYDFKIQWPLYFLQPDWLIRSFPSPSFIEREELLNSRKK